MRGARRRGFTLIEVAVAMVVASGFLVLSRAVLFGVADGAGRIAAAASANDDKRTSRQQLRAILAFARTVDPDSVAFLGSPRALFVRSYCPTPGGWNEACSVTVSIGDSTSTIYLGINYRRLTAIDRSARDFAALCYLQSVADGGRWLSDWPATHDLPMAVGLVIDRDTTILPVGR